MTLIQQIAMTGWPEIKLLYVMSAGLIRPGFAELQIPACHGISMTTVSVCMDTGREKGSPPSDLAQQVGHFDGSESCIEALVAAFGPRTFNGLLQGVGGKHSEDDRLAGLQSDLGNPF